MPRMGRYLCALLAGALCASASPAVAQRGPAPTMLKLNADVLALACAPRITYETPLASIHVTGGQDTFARRTYAPGDLVTINAGTDNGIEVGQEYYVRRVLRQDRRDPSRANPGVIRTVGWVRVYAVDEQMSLVTVTHACETIDVDDYLDPFSLPEMPSISQERPKPEKDNYARVLVGSDLRRSFGSGDFFIIDRGSDDGIEPGSQFVIFRDKLQYQNFLFNLGEAVAVDVGPDSATLKVTVSRDAFLTGDYVAMRRPQEPTP